MSSTPLLQSAETRSGTARRTRMQIGLAGGTPPQRSAVKEALAHVREVELDIADLGEEQPVGVLDPKLALLALLLDPAEQERWRGIFQLSHTAGPPPLMVALLPERTSELIQAALRAGADDVLSLPPSPEDALRALLRAGETQRRAQRQDKQCICALVSLSGGRGISSLTVCLGFAAQRLLNKRTALVDLDLQAAPLSVLLDVEPEHTIADLADPTSPINSIRLESVVTKHEAGPSLLAAPQRIEQTELVSAATVEAALKVLHDLFEVVLVDCGRHLSESSVVVFEHAHHLLYILDQSVAAVRAAQRFLALYNSLELKEQPQLIVNRYRTDGAVTLAQIEDALHLPVLATVPFDDATFKEMQTTGRDLWNLSAGVGLRRSIEGLTRKLLAPELQQPSRPGFFSRLFGSNR